MLKKICMVVMLTLLAANVLAYETWQDAFEAEAFEDAIALASTPDEEAGARLCFGNSYYDQKDYQQAVIEYGKVVIIADASVNYVADAQFRKARCLQYQDDYANAFTAYKAVFNSEGVWLRVLKCAFDGMLKTFKDASISDWAVICNWLLKKSDAITLEGETDEEKQAHQDFAEELISIAKRWAKNHQLTWDKELSQWVK